MIRWPIVWTQDGAEAKQRRAGGVRGGSSQGIIMYVLYMINLGSAVWFVWAFLAPQLALHWWTVVLLVWESDLDVPELKYLPVEFGISEIRPRCWLKCEIELFHLYVTTKKNTYCKTGVKFSISTLHNTLQMVAPNILPASWINYFTPRCQTVLQWARLYFCHLNFWAHFHANGKFIVTNRVTLAVTPYLNEYQVRLYFPAAIAH